MATETENETESKEAKRPTAPPRPPAFVWKRPFPLNDRIAPGTLCLARPILWFDEHTADDIKRGAVLDAWPKLQGDLHVTTERSEYICRVTGIDADDLRVHCPHDLIELSIAWYKLKMLCEVVPFPLPQLCEIGGAA